MQRGKGSQQRWGEGNGTVDAFAQPLAKQLLSPRSHKTCLTCPAPLRQAAGNACVARGWGAPLQAAPGGVGPLLSPAGWESGGLHSWDGGPRASGSSPASWQAMILTGTRLCPWDQPLEQPGCPRRKGETLQLLTHPHLRGASYGVRSRWRDGQRVAALWAPQPHPKVARGTGTPGWELWGSDPQAHCPPHPCPSAHPTARC